MYSLLECVVNTQAMAAEGRKDGRKGSQRGLEEKSKQDVQSHEDKVHSRDFKR